MVPVIEAALALVAVASSLVVYLKFIDKPLDKALDKMFAGWHVEELEDFE